MQRWKHKSRTVPIQTQLPQLTGTKISLDKQGVEEVQNLKKTCKPVTIDACKTPSLKVTTRLERRWWTWAISRGYRIALLDTLKTICWNTQGLGNPPGVCALHDLTRHEAPDLLFLLETKLPSRKLEVIKIHVGMHGCFWVHSVGREGDWPFCGKTPLK